MQESYRLLREALWYLEAQEDNEYSPHTLAIQRDSLIEQITHQVQAIEADELWSSQHDDASYISNKLPDGWVPKIQEPSRRLRFTARGPLRNGHCVMVLADTPQALEKGAQLHAAIPTAEEEAA